jgi:prepilin-type N-terminal cleavage/methylation domain-containing protein
MIPAPSRSDAGFTLVEVLVVLSVIGLMSALMLAMMGQFRRLTDAGHRLTDQAALKKTADHIAGLLERAEALPLDIKPDAPLFFLEAAESSARFLAVAKSGALTSGLFEIKIGLEKKDGIERLIETISPRRASENGAGKVTFELLERAERLTFSYLQKPESAGRAPVWRADWTTAGELPAAVRVSLQTKDKSGILTGASAIAYLAR